MKHYKINNPLPKDAKVIGIISDYQALPRYHFLIESAEWPELEDGQEIPIIRDLGFIDLRSADDHSGDA